MHARIATFSLCFLVTVLSFSYGAKGQTRLGNDTEAPPQRLALLIGNSNYEHVNTLKNPKNDVDKLAAKLSELGFQATVRKDLNHDQFVNELAAFTNLIGPGDIALFYYSGHGIQAAGGANYLIPVNLPANANAVTLDGTGISLGLVRKALWNAKLSLIILDACRSIGKVPAKGPLEGLAAFTSRGALIAYAADEGQSASDNDNEDVSLFTKFLISELDKHDEALCPLFTAVRQAVDDASQHAQFPYVYDGVIGDFIFNRTTTSESRNLATLGKSKAWTSIQFSNNPNDFAAYLSPYIPDKKHAKVAEGRLSLLMSETAKAVGVVPLDKEAPPEIVAIANQGARLFYDKSYEQALKSYGKVVESRPSDARALYDYATCLLYLGKYDEAVKSFSDAAGLDNEFVWTYLNRGVASHLKGNVKDAISDYTIALRLRPKYALGFNNLALAKRQDGDLKGAEEAVQQAIDLDPNYAPAYFNKATIRVALGDPSSATAYVAKGKSLTVPKMQF